MGPEGRSRLSAGRYARAGTHDGLIGEMIAVMGRDAATQLAMMTEMERVIASSTPGDPEAAAAYQARLDAVKAGHGSGVRRALRQERDR